MCILDGAKLTRKLTLQRKSEKKKKVAQTFLSAIIPGAARLESARLERSGRGHLHTFALSYPATFGGVSIRGSKKRSVRSAVAVKKSALGNLTFEPEATACRQAATYGIDLSLLADNLRLTPEQRMQRHDWALAVALGLRQAMTRTQNPEPFNL